MKLWVWLKIESVAWAMQGTCLNWVSHRVYDWLGAHAG